MALNVTPPHWLPSYTLDGSNNMVIPVASVPELTNAEANATTGDIRKLVYALCAKLHAAYQAEASADRPARMVISKASNYDPNSGQITAQYNFTFTLAAASVDVAAE